MKKHLILLLVFTICFSLCSCSNITSQQSPSTENTVPNMDKLEFEKPIILVNDPDLRIEVTNFFQELSLGLGTSEKGKYITLRFINHTDHTMSAILEQLSINDNGADVFRGSTYAEIPAKSDIVQYYRIRIDESQPLNEMEDLFQLKGILTIYRNAPDSNRTKLKTAHFYVAEAFASNVDASDETSVPAELSLGATAKTDMAEFTLNGFSTSTELRITPLNHLVKAESGMVFAIPDFSMRNTAKEIYGIEKALNFTVDYNDGYLYKMDDSVCYIVHEKGTWERRSVGTSSGQRPELPPLMSGNYQVYIPAIDLVETDTTAPLRIIVTLPSSDGNQNFVYRIR